MVYVPTNSFSLGDNTIAANGEFAFDDNTSTPGTSTSNPYVVASENPATAIQPSGLGTQAVNLLIPNNFTAGTQNGFPHGYAAFWIMKYEIINDQYVVFLMI